MPMFCGHKLNSKWRHSAIFIITMTHGIARATHCFTSSVQGHQKHQPWTRAVNTGVQFNTRVHGSCLRPVNTGSVYRALRSENCVLPLLSCVLWKQYLCTSSPNLTSWYFVFWCSLPGTFPFWWLLVAVQWLNNVAKTKCIVWATC